MNKLRLISSLMRTTPPPAWAADTHIFYTLRTGLITDSWLTLLLRLALVHQLEPVNFHVNEHHRQEGGTGTAVLFSAKVDVP